MAQRYINNWFQYPSELTIFSRVSPYTHSNTLSQLNSNTLSLAQRYINNWFQKDSELTRLAQRYINHWFQKILSQKKDRPEINLIGQVITNVMKYQYQR